MKIIQTFWTAGQDPLKHNFGWTHPEYNLMSWALSKIRPIPCSQTRSCT